MWQQLWLLSEIVGLVIGMCAITYFMWSTIRLRLRIHAWLVANNQPAYPKYPAVIVLVVMWLLATVVMVWLLWLLTR